MERSDRPKVPAGWTVTFDDFPRSDHPEDLKEDLMQVRHDAQNVLVDLGWYADHMGPDSGNFKIYVHRGNFEGPELAVASLPTLALAAAKMEELFRRFGGH